MKLYHFTSPNALPAISQHGLTLGDVPTDLQRYAGEVGVWLTSQSSPVGLGLSASALEKVRIRVEMDIPEDALLLHRWDDWKLKNATSETIEVLEKQADVGSDPSTWFIYFGWLHPKRVLEVLDMRSGEPIQDWSNGVAGYEPVKGVKYRDRHRWHRALMQKIRAFATKAKIEPTD